MLIWLCFIFWIPSQPADFFIANTLIFLPPAGRFFHKQTRWFFYFAAPLIVSSKDKLAYRLRHIFWTYAMLAKFQKSAYRLLMKISAGWGVEILLLWIFLPTGAWKFCCSGYFCRLGCGNFVALDISAGWMRKFCCSGYFCRLRYGNSIALDISAGWGMEILLLIKSFDRLGDLIYIVL